MVEQHSLFKAPPNQEERIWRYVDFTKLVAMLHTQALFFCRLDRLLDPFEGSYTALDNQQLSMRLKLIAEQFKGDPTAIRNLQESAAFVPQMRRDARKSAAINCWHRNERESAAMWDLYLKGRDLPVLVEWVRSFVGFEFEWEIELQVKPQSAPPAVLGADERLGWSTWLGQSHTSRAITGMVFQPEHYVDQ